MTDLPAHHDGTPQFLVRDGDSARVRVEVTSSTAPTSVWLRSEPDNEAHQVAMRLLSDRDGVRSYEAPLEIDGSKHVTSYCFKICFRDDLRWLSGLGTTAWLPERAFHFRFVPGYRPAAWVWDQVFYQIFPDRFCDGDSGNNVESGSYLYNGHPVVAKRWGDLPDRHQGAREFYGGDLAGIEARLDYLQTLGVSALYLNPVFTSPSSHKYDTVDYAKVDPHLGGNEALASLCAALRKRGMRLVLDAVVNHTSEQHPWFDRYGEHSGGAYASPDSAYRDHYVFRNDEPESYVGWKGVRTLPVLDFSSEGVVDAIVRHPEAVLRRWLRPPYAIDGWRFDVIHMLGSGAGAKDNADLVRAFRQSVREERADAYVLGEHFAEASPWLQGDQEDGAMNYHGFTRPLQTFLAGSDATGQPVQLDAAGLDRWLTGARAQLPFPIQLSQLNLLDSHDTPRLLTTLGGDIRRLKVAVVAQLAYLGVPCIYYGDEIGLEGGPDPDCRRCFPWEERSWDRDLLALYRTLIAVRRARPELRRGGLRTLHAVGDTYAFARTLGKEVSVAVLHRGEAIRLTLALARLAPGRRWRDAVSGEVVEADGALELAPVSARLLLAGD